MFAWKSASQVLNLSSRDLGCLVNPALPLQRNLSYHASSNTCLFVLAVAFYQVIPFPCGFCSGSSLRTVFLIILLSITSHAFAYICQMCNPSNLHMLFHSKSPASAQVTTNPASSSMHTYHVQKHAQTAAFLLHTSMLLIHCQSLHLTWSLQKRTEIGDDNLLMEYLSAPKSTLLASKHCQSLPITLPYTEFTDVQCNGFSIDTHFIFSIIIIK